MPVAVRIARSVALYCFLIWALYGLMLLVSGSFLGLIWLACSVGCFVIVGRMRK